MQVSNGLGKALRVIRSILFASFLFFGVVAFWEYANKGSEDLRLAMPTIAVVKQPGSFQELRGDWFDVQDLAEFTYEVSEDVYAASDKIYSFDKFWPRNSYSYIPKTDEAAPLVILFHGAGRNGLSVLDMWLETAEDNGIVLLAPNSLGSSWPSDHANPRFIQKLIANISAQTEVDQSRIYLFGHSDGAAYAQLLLNRSTGPWVAASLHAGFTRLNLLKVPQDPKPFRLYIGDREHIFPLNVARSYGESLAEYGYENELILIPRHTHWLYDIGSQIADDSWEWLLSQPHAK